MRMGMFKWVMSCQPALMTLPKKTHAIGMLAVCAFALAGCNNQAGIDAAAHTATYQMQHSAAMGALMHDYVQARAAQQWDLALVYGDRLQRIAPNSEYARNVQATLLDTSMHADQVRDRHRLSGLWAYTESEASGDGSDGIFVSASIAADNKSDGDGAAPARLVLRRHHKFGRSALLVLDHGQFDCAPGCSVSVKFDDAPARAFAAGKTDQNRQALAIVDEQAIRSNLDKIRVVTIDTSVDGKPRSLSFAVGGFNRGQFERQLQ